MTTKTGILYLQKDRFHLYSPYSSNILEFRFVPELIRDFDLINKELLENLLKVFFGNNKILPSGLVIVVGDSASFIKDFVSPPVTPSTPPSVTPPPTLEDLQNFANQYIEQVPFEEVASRTFPLATGVRAYATNQDVYESFKTILEKLGFIIEGVFPGFAFGAEISAKPMLDGQSVAVIMQKLSAVRAYNLLKDTSTVVSTPAEEEVAEKEIPATPEKNKKMFMIGAITVIVLVVIVTGVVIYNQFTYQPYQPPSAGSATIQPTSAPAQTVVSPTTAVLLDVKTLTVQITAVSSSATTAEKVRTVLSPYGFKSVTTQTQDTLGSAQALLIFSPKVQASARTTVTAEVKKVLGDVLIQEKSDAPADIVVILGK